MSTRGSWGSRLGFILAVAGSAVGLANIWRFPYVVGQNGGAAFIFAYLACLFIIGFPVFIAEILIGRTAQTSPSGAFASLGRGAFWGWAGKLTILTGFLVSSFYSAVAGWILGYFIEALRGNITGFTSSEQPELYFNSLMADPWWGLTFHLFFILFCGGVLFLGVHKGIERWNKILMPILLGLLVLLAIKGLTLPNADDALGFLLSPDWSLLTPTAILLALGQAFFTLSLGQGTMVTYGSYVGEGENLLRSCVPVVIVDLCVSILAAIAVFTIVFSVGMQPDSGPGLLFHTLPWVFSQLPGGYLLALFFFMIVVIAALTSEISAMEPTIAYLMDEWGWGRKAAVGVCAAGVFLFGIPSALSFSFLDSMSFVCSSILIPLGGLLAVVLVGWIWGVSGAIEQLKQGSSELFRRRPWLQTYFWFCFKYASPILIVLVFLNALGVFG